MTTPSATKSRWATGVIVAVGVSCLGFVAAFFSGVIIARLLGAEGRGIYSLFRTSTFGIAIFAGLGFGSGQMFHASKNPRQLRHFLPTGYAVSAVLGTAGALLYFFGGEAWGLKTVTALGLTGAWLAIGLVPVLLMLQSQRQYLLTVQAYSRAKILAALSEGLPLLVYVVFYLLRHAKISAVLATFALSQMFLFVVSHWTIPRNQVDCKETRVDFVKESFGFGIRRYLSGFAEYMTSRLDYYVVTWFLGASGLGIYAVAVSMAEITGRVPSELGTILFPAFASGRISKTGAAAILRTTFFLAAVLALFLAVVGGSVIHFLFGDQFAEAIPAFRWLLLGTVAWSTIYVTGNHASAAGKPAIGVPIFGAAALLDFLLDLVLIPKFGVVGASLAATASYWLAAFLFLSVFCKIEGCSLSQAVFVRASDLQSLLASVKGLQRYFLRTVEPSAIATLSRKAVER